MVLPEIESIGIYNSQIKAKNVKVSKNRKTSMFEIELPIENGGISYIDSKSTPITPNTVICAKPGQVRHTRFPFKCYYVHMTLQDGVLYDILMNTPDFFKTEKTDLYRRIFKDLKKHYNTFIKSDEIILQSLILELIYTISRDQPGPFTDQKKRSYTHRPAIEKALKYVDTNLTEDLSLEKVAQFAHLSPIHFHNSFKSAVGKTLRNYVEEQRLKKAIDLLETTDYSLTQIAFECGFSSQSYFSYVFKRRMNKTPRGYIREINSKYEL